MRKFFTRIAKRGREAWQAGRKSITAWNQRRIRIKEISRSLLSNPLFFTIKDGRQVKVFRAGIKNLHGLEEAKVRPIVFCIVGNKLLYFYKSTGTTGKKGEWLPFSGIRFSHDNEPGNIVKFEGHPNFPRWVEEISGQIKEKEKEIQFENWSPEDYLYIDQRVFRTRYDIKPGKLIMRGVQRFNRLE